MAEKQKLVDIRDTLERIKGSAEVLARDCPPPPHACDACEILFLANEALEAIEQPKCFLLEDDPPEQHGKPIACAQCWNALSEMERWSASKSANMSSAVDEYQSLVNWLFSVEHQIPKERTTAHRISELIEGLRTTAADALQSQTNWKACAGRIITVDDVSEVLRELVWSIRGNDGASPELMKAHEMLHTLGKTFAGRSR